MYHYIYKTLIYNSCMKNTWGLKYLPSVMCNGHYIDFTMFLCCYDTCRSINSNGWCSVSCSTPSNNLHWEGDVAGHQELEICPVCPVGRHLHESNGTVEELAVEFCQVLDSQAAHSAPAHSYQWGIFHIASDYGYWWWGTRHCVRQDRENPKVRV